MKKSDLEKIAKFQEWLDELATEIRDKVSEREDVFYDRSESWQESEKGEAYQSKTEDMEEDADYIEDISSTIEELLEKYN